MVGAVLLLLLVNKLLACSPYCNNCDISLCTACADGYSLTTESQCVADSSFGCSLYDNNGLCIACQPTFEFVNSTCLKEYNGCLQRGFGNVGCVLCAPGKLLVEQNCVGTLNCLEGGQKCIKCKPGFRLEGEYCIDQTLNCMIADGSSNGVCSMCTPGLILIGYQCLESAGSPQNCYIYDSSKNCQTCKDGYILNSLQRCVIPGNDVCEEFNQNRDCLNCKNNLLTIINGSCVDVHCKIGGSLGCITCETGYAVKNGSTICELVDPNCEKLVNNSISRCEICKRGYFVIVNGSCSPLSKNCIAGNIISLVCIQCQPGYTLSIQGECIPPFQIANCLEVDFPARTCARCTPGYFKYENTCKKASALCNKFSPLNGQCLACKAGYQNVGGECVDWNCDKKQGDICKQCINYYRPSALTGLCQYYDSNCAKINFNGCDACLNGYYLNPIRCVPFPPYCTAIANDYSCSQCRKGWTLVNKLCVILITNCQEYDYKNSISYCKSCSYGYDLVNQKCVFIVSNTTSTNLDPNCLTFNKTTCTRCSNRYYLSGATCVPINPNCKNYSADGKCTDCYLGYNLLEGQCIISSFQKDSNCKTFNNLNCVECSKGYFLNSTTKTCEQISQLCKASNSSTGACLQCYIGYSLSQGICNAVSNDPNCIRFNAGGDCEACSTRFFKKDKTCTPISPLCKTYNVTIGYCLSCYPGYYLLNGACATGFDPNLDINCRLKGSNGLCLQCYSNYYIASNSSCTMVNPLCRTFNTSNGACLTCYPGYIIAGATCILQNQINSDPNCVKYAQNKLCDQCYSGFFIRQGVCTKINPLCKTSDPNNGWCQSCYPGYQLTANGDCQIPQSFTLSIQDPYCTQRSGGICTQCSNGYYPKSGVCKQLNPLCRTYDRQSGNCTSCYSGYIISQDTCIILEQKLIPFCLLVKNNLCSHCMLGYYKNTPQSCSPVSILCKTYDQNTGNCLSCIYGYFLQIGQCVYPSMGYDGNCISYDQSAYCSLCKPGYYLLNYICSRIDPYCSNFDSPSQTCLACGGGKSPSGSQCK